MTISITSYDGKALTEFYQQHGFAQIPGILSQADLERLVEPLSTQGPWAFVEGGGEKPRTIYPADRMQMMTSRRTRELNTEIYSRAADGPQYALATCPVLPDTPEGLTERADFADMLKSPEMTTLLQDITGLDGLEPTHAETILMSQNQFITRNVRFEGEPKALVFIDLTETWRPEWGATGLIYGQDGAITHAYIPELGRLTVLDPARPFSISSVTTFSRFKHFALLASYA